MTTESLTRSLKPHLPSEDKVNKLLELRRTEQDLRRVLDVFGELNENEFEITVDDARKMGDFFSATDVISTFRWLERLGWGRFRVGRRGYKSRFGGRWKLRGIYDVSVGKPESSPLLPSSEILAKADEPSIADGMIPAMTAAEAGQIKMVEHIFHLRPILDVCLSLPENLSQSEAARLAAFLQSLPF